MKDLEVKVFTLIAIDSRQSLINPSIANHAQKYLTKQPMRDVPSDGLHFLVWIDRLRFLVCLVYVLSAELVYQA